MATRFIDIGANLCDPMFYGVYNGKQKHDADHLSLLTRAWDSGLSHIMITASDLATAQKAIDLIDAVEHLDPTTKGKLSTTIGVHPTCCSEFDRASSPEDYMASLLKFGVENTDRITAIGEFGLDYERLEYCPKETQIKYFEAQFELLQLGLPMFLHSRAAHKDFIEILHRHRSQFTTGCVHSFTGTMDEMKACVEMGLYIGINGCSLKTTENLEVVKAIPADKLMLETDAPWCDIRPTHAGSSFVKTHLKSVKKEKWDATLLVRGRNEPCNIVQVLEVVASVRGDNQEELADQVFRNSHQVFLPNRL